MIIFLLLSAVLCYFLSSHIAFKCKDCIMHTPLYALHIPPLIMRESYIMPSITHFIFDRIITIIQKNYVVGYYGIYWATTMENAIMQLFSSFSLLAIFRKITLQKFNGISQVFLWLKKFFNMIKVFIRILINFFFSFFDKLFYLKNFKVTLIFPHHSKHPLVSYSYIHSPFLSQKKEDKD